MIIVRFAEIGLKGKNRSFFEKALVKNIKACLDYHKVKYRGIARPMGRIFIETDDSGDCLRCVFGIASFSSAVNAGFSMGQVKKAALLLAKTLSPKNSFRITCQRLDKGFPISSRDFCVELGAFVQEKTGAKVKMDGFDLNICAEIIDSSVYLFTEKKNGPGGLPVGVEGNVIVLVEDDCSLLAGLLMMKRGCRIIPVALKNRDVSLLESYSFGQKIVLNLLNHVSDAGVLASKMHAKFFVAGDLLEDIRDYPVSMAVLRPLIAYGLEGIQGELDGFRQRVC